MSDFLLQRKKSYGWKTVSIHSNVYEAIEFTVVYDPEGEEELRIWDVVCEKELNASDMMIIWMNRKNIEKKRRIGREMVFNKNKYHWGKHVTVTI